MQPAMGGYQLMVAADIFRGRYRESFEVPKAIAADTPVTYRFALPMANHVFLPGHRMMVQIQSRGSRSTTATRRRSCRTSSGRSREITGRPCSGSITRRIARASSSCRSCRAGEGEGISTAGVTRVRGEPDMPIEPPSTGGRFALEINGANAGFIKRFDGLQTA